MSFLFDFCFLILWFHELQSKRVRWALSQFNNSIKCSWMKSFAVCWLAGTFCSFLFFFFHYFKFKNSLKTICLHLAERSPPNWTIWTPFWTIPSVNWYVTWLLGVCMFFYCFISLFCLDDDDDDRAITNNNQEEEKRMATITLITIVIIVITFNIYPFPFLHNCFGFAHTHTHRGIYSGSFCSSYFGPTL